MKTPDETELERGAAALPQEVALAFAPVHKRAFGLAAGAAAALLVGLLTLMHLLRSPAQPYPLSLLAEFFYGYRVSVSGIAVGMFWAGLAGFVFGWFLAFVRNLALASTLFVLRTKAELQATGDFLDHI